ncbi:hypothetical protein PO124_13015 [Bacillus licheniformis]|nr:hypothetical protein [Bacillus licheniformis]
MRSDHCKGGILYISLMKRSKFTVAYIADDPPHQMKQPITISPGEIDAVKRKRISVDVCLFKTAGSCFAIRFPEEEAVYLTLHILGGKVRYPFGKEGDSGLETLCFQRLSNI